MKKFEEKCKAEYEAYKAEINRLYAEIEQLNDEIKRLNARYDAYYDNIHKMHRKTSILINDSHYDAVNRRRRKINQLMDVIDAVPCNDYAMCYMSSTMDCYI